MFELQKRGLWVECEDDRPIFYDGHHIDTGYRVDMLIENCAISKTRPSKPFCPSIRRNY